MFGNCEKQLNKMLLHHANRISLLSFSAVMQQMTISDANVTCNPCPPSIYALFEIWLNTVPNGDKQCQNSPARTHILIHKCTLTLTLTHICKLHTTYCMISPSYWPIYLLTITNAHACPMHIYTTDK